MGYIKASTDTQFPVGKKVKITDKGQSFTTYKAMVNYMSRDGVDMKEYTAGFNHFRNDDVGTVVGKAMHEDEHYGEVLAVKNSSGSVGLIRAVGVVEFEEPVVIGKPKLDKYELAPLTPEATERLSKYFDKAPAWATHVGSDHNGVHFFDHHPHIFKGPIGFGAAFLKGLLPSSHKHDMFTPRDNSVTLEVAVIVRKAPATTEEQLEALKVELATTKAKLWDAERKLKKIAELAE